MSQVAEMLGPGHTIVTCLCDTGQRYYARLFNKEWLETKGKQFCKGQGTCSMIKFNTNYTIGISCSVFDVQVVF